MAPPPLLKGGGSAFDAKAGPRIQTASGPGMFCTVSFPAYRGLSHPRLSGRPAAVRYPPRTRAGADGHAVERIFGDVDVDACSLEIKGVEPARAAAGQGNAAVDDIGGQLGRSPL